MGFADNLDGSYEREGKCNSTVSDLNNKKNDIAFTEIVKKGERTDLRVKISGPIDAFHLRCPLDRQ